jgi:DnaK suppressor protein
VDGYTPTLQSLYYYLEVPMGFKKKELENFKNLLQEERRKVLRHLEDLSESSQEELDLTTGDSVDLASLEINQNSMHKIGKRETYLLKKIDLALSKIDEGSYGECESCGEQIAVGRLMARPVAQLCIDCKTEQENQEKRFSSKERDAADLEGGMGDDEAE